ncbi:MAG: L,D-transpeptidase [Actinomycetota bacterium]|nr:L,D-transpeptidase [Actinomycetota bacterium]
MTTWTRGNVLALTLLLIGGACASDPVVIPGPQPEPVRMLNIGTETETAGMAMAAGPDDPVSTTAAPSLPSSTSPTTAPTTKPPQITTAITTTVVTTTTAMPQPTETPTTGSPDTPFTVAMADVPLLEVFKTPGSDQATWILPNPGPGEGERALLVLGAESGWLRVSVPVRPNGTVGWIHEDQVFTVTYQARIIVDLYQRSVEAWEGGILVSEGTIASGSDETPTPAGSFFVTEIQEYSDPGSGTNTWLIGTSAYSESLDPTADGDPAVAIIGVGDPRDLGKAISQGCIQVPFRVLQRLAQLPLGTPVQILG